MLSNPIPLSPLWQAAPPILRRQFIFTQQDNYRQRPGHRTQIQNDMISALLVFPPLPNFVTSPLYCLQVIGYFHYTSSGNFSLQSCDQLTLLCGATSNQILLSIKCVNWDTFALYTLCSFSWILPTKWTPDLLLLSQGEEKTFPGKLSDLCNPREVIFQ